MTETTKFEIIEGRRYNIRVDNLEEISCVYAGAEYKGRFKGKRIFFAPDDEEYLILDDFCMIEHNGSLSHGDLTFPITVKSKKEVEEIGGTHKLIDILLAEERFFQR